MVEGRTHRPVIDRDACRACAVCVRGCPAEWIDEYRKETDSLRGAAYRERHGRLRRNEATVPPCREACPAGLETARYAGLVAKGAFDEAAEVIRRALPFPRTVGLICNHPCEQACTRGRYVDEAVALCALKSFAASAAGPPPPAKKPPRTGRRAAIIGAGPAGLACAHDLALAGHDVTVFEASSGPGGMLNAIPGYRLPKDELAGEIDRVLSLGIDLRYGVQVGRDLSLARIRDDYDALFIAAGAQSTVAAGVEGEDLAGVIDGIRFLREVEGGRFSELGRRTVVIGRGNTAADCARAAKRLGSEVVLLYGKSAGEVLAVLDGMDELASQGVDVRFLVAPVKFTGTDGKVSGVECVRLSEGGTNGPVGGSAFSLPADTVIVALGQAVDASFTQTLAIPLAADGTIRIDPATGATGREGVFAGGDVVTGPLYVIDAIAAGKRAAASMDAYMMGTEIRERKDVEAL